MRIPSTPGRRRDGLSLVEIIIAAAVLSVLILGMFSTMNISQKSEYLSRERNAAMEVACMELDKYMGQNYDELPSQASFGVSYDTGKVIEATGLPLIKSLTPPTPYPSGMNVLNAAHPGQINFIQDPFIEGNSGATCGPDVVEIRITVAWVPNDWDPKTNPGYNRIDLVTRRARGQ